MGIQALTRVPFEFFIGRPISLCRRFQTATVDSARFNLTQWESLLWFTTARLAFERRRFSKCGPSAATWISCQTPSICWVAWQIAFMYPEPLQTSLQSAPYWSANESRWYQQYASYVPAAFGADRFLQVSEYRPAQAQPVYSRTAITFNARWVTSTTDSNKSIC